MQGIIVESKVLHGLQVGSYEELLTNLDEAISDEKSQAMLGASAVLFATYPKHVIVINEEGKFFSVDYENKDGIVKIGAAKKIDVAVLSEDDVISRAVDNFADGKSLKDSLRKLVEGCAKCDSPLEEIQRVVGALFSRGRIFRSYLSEHYDVIGQFAWDADYGKLGMEIDPKFSDLYSDEISESEIELHRKEVIDDLVSVEGRLQKKVAEVSEAFEEFQNRTIEPRGEELDGMLSKFESFSADYIDYLTEVADFVSDTVRKSNEGCVACAAFVHDEVARRFREVELGGRFIRKVATEFTR